jgi:hypothetical protein
VRCDDERSPAHERRDEAGGNEEVRVDDVGPPGRERPSRERQITKLPSGPRVEHGELDLMAAGDQLPLDLGDERPEIGRLGARVHLGYEEDAHGASVRGPRAPSSS